MKTIQDIKNNWGNTEELQKAMHENMCELVDNDHELKLHRDFVQDNVFGFGERSFWWAWKLICAELPENPTLLEIGVFRSATLSLWKLLRPDSKVFGITPLDTSGDMWESDYEADIKHIHDKFNLPQPFIFKGRSDNPEIVAAASSFLYDVVYIDGSHTFEDSLHDLNTYARLVKEGGFLVVDDAASRFNMPFGYFTGIKEVCDALQTWEASAGAKRFEFCFNVKHLMVYKRV